MLVKKRNVVKLTGNSKILSVSTDVNCYYCNRKTRKNGGLTKDHIIPKILGGSNYSPNVVYCCYNCNQFKGNKMPQKWFEEINEYIKLQKPSKRHDIQTMGTIKKKLKTLLTNLNITDYLK